MQKFIEKKYDRVDIIYNQFKNAAIQVLKVEQFLPIQIKEGQNANRFNNYIFEPDKAYIVDVLIPKSLIV